MLCQIKFEWKCREEKPGGLERQGRETVSMVWAGSLRYRARMLCGERTTRIVWQKFIAPGTWGTWHGITTAGKLMDWRGGQFLQFADGDVRFFMHAQ